MGNVTHRDWQIAFVRAVLKSFFIFIFLLSLSSYALGISTVKNHQRLNAFKLIYVWSNP